MDIDARSPDGNAFAIMGAVRRLLIDSGRGDDWPDTERRMQAGDYNNLCDIAEKVTYGSIQVVNRNAAMEDEKD